MITDIYRRQSSPAKFDPRSIAARERDTLPILDNFINCCNYNCIDALATILQNELEYFKANPQKIVDGYLNYCASGHEEVFKALLNFTQNNNIKAQDETFDCFEYLYNKRKVAVMDVLLENDIWSYPGLITHMRLRAEAGMRPEEKNSMLGMAANLEKHMLEQQLKNRPTSSVKPKFKL